MYKMFPIICVSLTIIAIGFGGFVMWCEKLFAYAIPQILGALYLITVLYDLIIALD